MLDTSTAHVVITSVTELLDDAQQAQEEGRFEDAQVLLNQAESLEGVLWDEPFEDARQTWLADPRELHWI